MSGLGQQRDGIRPKAADGFNRRKCEEQRQRGAQSTFAGRPDVIMPGVAVTVMLVIVIVILAVIVAVIVMFVGVVSMSHT